MKTDDVFERGVTWIAGILTVAMILFLAVMIFKPDTFGMGEAERNRRHEQYMDEGRSAQQAGVPANANPYRAGGSPAWYWLEGWKAENSVRRP